jgi:hypothetical protein
LGWTSTLLDARVNGWGRGAEGGDARIDAPAAEERLEALSLGRRCRHEAERERLAVVGHVDDAAGTVRNDGVGETREVVVGLDVESAERELRVAEERLAGRASATAATAVESPIRS